MGVIDVMMRNVTIASILRRIKLHIFAKHYLTKQRKEYTVLEQKYSSLKRLVESPSGGKPLSFEDEMIAFFNRIAKGGDLLSSMITLIKSPYQFSDKPQRKDKDRLIFSFMLRLSQNSDPSIQKMGYLLLGIWYSNKGVRRSKSIDYFNKLDRAHVLKHALIEFYVSWIRIDEDAALLDLLKTAETMQPTDDNYVRVLKLLISRYKFTECRELLNQLGDGHKKLCGPKKINHIENLKSIVSNAPIEKASDECLHIAVMSYKNIFGDNLSSINLGDYIQTLAFLAILARFDGLVFDADDDLGAFVLSLQKRIKEEDKIKTSKRTVKLIPINRDCSNFQTLSQNTLFVANGWFMHYSFYGKFDFPLNNNAHPIFLSLHLNERFPFFNEDVKAHFKRYEPIGCRDLVTTYRLRNLGIDAFFSGCLTMTLGNLFDYKRSNATLDEAFVDISPNSPHFYQHEFAEVGDMSLVEALNESVSRLDNYTRYKKINTSRLHCYLPCHSIGIPTVFVNMGRETDRFSGLIDISNEAFDGIRKSIESQLISVLSSAIADPKFGALTKDWRTLCEAPLKIAKADFNKLAHLKQSTMSVDHISADFRAHRVDFDSTIADLCEVNIAFALDNNLKNILPVVLNSIVKNSSKYFKVYILSINIPMEYFSALNEKFPTMCFSVFDFSNISYPFMKVDGRVHKSGRAMLPVNTLGRLWLPELCQI